MEQCQVSARQATYLLRKLVTQGLLVQQGAGRGTVYSDEPVEIRTLIVTAAQGT